MNSNGFTLVEVIVVIVLISLVSFFTIRSFGTTVSFGKDEAYQIMKNNIVSASYDYVNECIAETISCDFSFETQHQFVAGVLKEKGFFHSMKSPIDGKDLSECLILDVTKKNGVIVSTLIDDCY